MPPRLLRNHPTIPRIRVCAVERAIERLNGQDIAQEIQGVGEEKEQGAHRKAVRGASGRGGGHAVEEILEKGTRQLADARERVERAVATAGSKRTVAAHAAADRAREAVALINERRLHVATRLREAREAIRDELGEELDALERALKESVEHYEEALKANERRVPRRPRDPRNR